MNTDNWKVFYKCFENNNSSIAQTTYEPLISLDNSVFCYNYNHKNTYTLDSLGPRPLYTEEVVKWYFDNEVKNLLYFAKKLYAPEILDIDYKKQKIFIRWGGVSCNHVIYDNNNHCSSEWIDNIEEIMLDLYSEKFYKLTMYPHCHFIDQHGVMKSIDWYGCLPSYSPLVPKNCIDAIIHESAKFRLDETGPANAGYYNMEIMFKRGLEEHVQWGNTSLKFIHAKIFNE